jgi:hypothetical protein
MHLIKGAGNQMKVASDSSSSSPNDRAILTNLSRVIPFLYPNPWTVNDQREMAFMLVLISSNHDIGFPAFLLESVKREREREFVGWETNKRYR